MSFFDREGRPMSLEAWGKAMEDLEGRRIAETFVGPYRVSTVWLGINHNFLGVGPPIIYETMIFDWRDEVRAVDELPFRVRAAIGEVHERLPLDNEMWRYATEDQARQGHVEACEFVRIALEVGVLEAHNVMASKEEE